MEAAHMKRLKELEAEDGQGEGNSFTSKVWRDK